MPTTNFPGKENMERRDEEHAEDRDRAVKAVIKSANAIIDLMRAGDLFRAEHAAEHLLRNLTKARDFQSMLPAKYFKVPGTE